MLEGHSFNSNLKIKKNNTIFKIKPIQRKINMFSKYPENSLNKTNCSYNFYRNKSKQILHNDYVIYSYKDIIL